ncbi:MAG TPA: ABC transporter substrate-binding protein [Vicinamibacteria bacterium]
MTALASLLFLATAADTLVVGLLAEPGSLDPHRATDLVSAAVVVNVCEPLVRFRPGGSRPEGALATTWATIDRRTWTFTLREGVRFHDGTLLDADAVVANLERLRRLRAFPGRAERAGAHVVTIALDRPDAALLATLSQPFFALQSPKRLSDDLADRAVGTGPFRIAAVRPGQVELEANPDHWAGAPRLKRVVFRRLPDEDALVTALLAADVDLTSAVGQDRVGRLRTDPRVTFDSRIGLNVAFLCPNNEKGPLRDVRVRQALARGLDRADLVQRTLGGHGEPARNPLPPSLWGYDRRTKDLALDPASARRLLAEAGYAQGLDLELALADSPRPYLPSPRRVAQEIREDLLAIGVRTRLREIPTWADYTERVTRGDYEMALLGWQADTMDPNDFLSALLASDSIGTTNRSRYRSAAMDAILKRGRMGSDPDSRLSAYHEAQTLFQKDMPWIPLYHGSVFTVHRRSLRGLNLGPTGLVRYDKAWKLP